MNKTQLIKKVAEKAGMKKTDTTKLVNAMFQVIQETLKAGEDIRIVGFGSFKVVKRAARKVRNPRTGKPMKVPAKKVVKFSPGKGLTKIK